MAISRHDHLRMHMFVDDPLYLAAGDENDVTLPLTRALLWAVVAGFPLAWHKSDGGSTVTWIGAKISMENAAVSISIPEDKIREYKEGLKYMKTSRPLRLKAVRSIAGKLPPHWSRASGRSPGAFGKPSRNASRTTLCTPIISS